MNVINWLVDHQLVLGGIVVSIFDLLFAINSKWESNGILHWFYVFFKNLGKPAQPSGGA